LHPQPVSIVSQSPTLHTRPAAVVSRDHHVPATQVAESSKSAGKRNASGPLPTSSRSFKISRPGDGWYVAHNAVLPGVCFGA
jgi:hypothetical protein